ncbi:hypothetical protein PVT68_09070 [Microbulbifer bruguierae]|uniref:Uncharacterized protein n=1 Tax=Microbulbifer bruguierae TaxID=3029061 RepID=A0ABY8NIL2_9GAMM|nr:hypothetical protein [Microbulbifer bruguierae]WGL18432.1 hypothetical protein PVT68_09070 [Microbulbifer bruguierae]
MIERDHLANVAREDLGAVIGKNTNLPILKYVGEDFIVVSISSEVDLVEMARGHNIVAADVHFCDDTESKYFVGLDLVYLEGWNVDSRSLWDRAKSESPDVYDLIVYTHWEVTKDANKGWSGYSKLGFDLHESPRDVCIRLRYFDMVRVVYSNEIKISGDEIQELLSR